MKMKLCNVHRLALSNEGEERKPIHIPFGTWDYDDRITQTLDREHAEKIANELAASVAKGEPGIPVYQGHPDVPEYAGKYPDKGALGWVKKIMVNENGMDLEVEWDRDPGKGFGWFSPYWVGDEPTVGADGKKNVIVDGLTSVGLVNNPNIREFRLANEAGEILTQRRGGAENVGFVMPAHLVALAKRFDDRRALPNVVDANGMGHSDENGQFDGSGSGGGGGSSQSARLDRLQGEARNKIAAAKEGAAASRARRGKYSAELESRIAEIRKKRLALKDFNDKMEARLGGMPNEANFDESKHPRDNDGKFSSTGGGGGGASEAAPKKPKERTDGWRELPDQTARKSAQLASRIKELGGNNREAQSSFLNRSLSNNREALKSLRHRDGQAASDAYNGVRQAHKAAIMLGLKYNRATHQYE